jgi:hypothetical protein
MKKTLLPLLLLFAVKTVSCMDLKLEVNLKGEWRFEIGDNPDYAKPNFDDKEWEVINVPSQWENEGFPGYDGYAWYRLWFTTPPDLKSQNLYLSLGRIDDVDQTYLNGHFVGSEGVFPPNYHTAWNIRRIYHIPADKLVIGGRNLLAVRVYDSQMGGGIIEGDIGIYSRLDIIHLDMNLSGKWYFSPGDDVQWAEADYDHSHWKQVDVPAYWRDIGFPELNGFAWYRTSVNIPKTLAADKLILLLGKVNDLDQVYFNGTVIGRTGDFPDGSKSNFLISRRDEERAYFIPPYLIKPGKTNTIAVRVYDLGGLGGIYEGYIGITTRNEYLKYSKRRK